MLQVLVVDDDRAVAALHAAVLERVPGFALAGVARSGRDVRELLDRHYVDLMLLDLNLPDEHGLSIIQSLVQERDGRPEVIVVSADRAVSTVSTARRLGVIEYLIKPFPTRMLIERLEEYRDEWLDGRGGL